MDSLDLSRRAVAAGWKWQAGTVSTTGLRVTDTYKDGLPCAWTFTDDEHFAKPFNNYGIDEFRAGFWNLMLPDFRDAATRGVLLQQVRERRNAPHGYVTCGRSRCASQDYAPGVWDWCWAFWDDQETFVASGDSETAALVCAMEAAPKEKGL